MSLLIPQPTITLSLSRNRAHIPLLTPPSWLTIPQSCHRDTISLDVFTESSMPQSLSLIPQARRIFLGLYQHIRCCCWVLGTVLLFRQLYICHQYPEPVTTPAPPPLETFTWTCCLFCFLSLRLYSCCRDFGIIFLCWSLHRGYQLLCPIIATPQPLVLSLNLRSHIHIVYSLSFANASIVVIDLAGQSVKDYLILGCCLCIFFCDVFHLWLLGMLLYLTVLGTTSLKTVEVQN